MNVQDVRRLLAVANNYLPSVQNRYDTLKIEISALEGEKRNSTMVFQGLTDQISSLHKTSDSYRLECQKKRTRISTAEEDETTGSDKTVRERQ